MLVVQLELKEVLFSTNHVEGSSCEPITFSGSTYFKRNGLDDFIITLAKHFRIAIWSRYKNELQIEMIDYINKLGVYTEYTRSWEDCTQFNNGNEYILEKRLKKLNYPISEIIILENETPRFENYDNSVIVKAFLGQSDNELADVLKKLTRLETVEDTRRLN